jgi:hypothetical protein
MVEGRGVEISAVERAVWLLQNYDDAYPTFAAKVEEFLLEQEQMSITSIQQERVKGGKAGKSDDEHLKQASSQINPN